MAMDGAILDLHVRTTLESPGRSFALDACLRSATQRTALVGASGSGKSTVLMAIAGLAPGVHGHVRVAGRTLLDTAQGIVLPARDALPVVHWLADDALRRPARLVTVPDDWRR